jgi:hypothetical protein
VHRLVQAEFFQYLSNSERQTAFRVTATLLLRAFPSPPDSGSMYDVWPKCQLHAVHIAALIERFQQVAPEVPRLHPSGNFCELLAVYAW